MLEMQQLEQGLIQSYQQIFGSLKWTVIDLLRQATAEAGDSPAILEPDRASLSYNALLELVTKTVQTLNALGYGSASRIALALPTSSEAATAYLSVMSGMTALMMSPVASAEEYERYLSNTRVDAVLAQQDTPTAIREVAASFGVPLIEMRPLMAGPAGMFELVGAVDLPVVAAEFAQPDDVSIVAPTSGTTSLPKFVPRTQKEAAISIYAFIIPFLSAAGPVINMLPLYHGAGAVGIVAAVGAKKGYACLRGFDPAQAYRYLALYQPESLFCVPALLNALVAQAPDHQEELAQFHLKLIYSGSSTLSAELLHDVQRVFGAAVTVGYGLTETGPVTSLVLTSGSNQAYTAGSVGKPIPLCQVRITDEAGASLPAGESGEIVIMSPLMTRAYENNPEANAAQYRDGWFRTGDTGYLDAEGLLYVTGRIKEVINRGGSKISPLEVDDIIKQHPAVVEAATFGFPHAALGEDLATAIVSNDPSVTESQLRLFASQRLPMTKIPSRFVFVCELPKTSSGKIRRNLLAEQFAPALRR